TPIWRCTAQASRTTSRPATGAEPASGRVSVVRMRTAVVVPAPFGPSTPRMAPRGTSGSSPASATVGPNRFRSPSALLTLPTGKEFHERRPRGEMRDRILDVALELFNE